MMYERLMLATKTKEGLIPAITQTQIVNNSKCCHGLKTQLHVLLNKMKTKRALFPLPCENMFKIKKHFTKQDLVQNK